MTVLATSTPVIVAREEAVEDSKNLRLNLVQILYIRYPINFRKKFIPVLALLDLDSKYNTIYLTFAKELGFSIRPIDVGAQKFDGIILKTFRIVVAAFLVTYKANQERFFEETFLVANISLEIVFEISFLILSGADVNFLGQKLWWRAYIIKKAFPTTRRIELVGKKEFTVAVLDLEDETYIVYIGLVSSIALPSSFFLNIHLFHRPQMANLITKKTFTKVPAKYLNFPDIFSLELASQLSEHTGINNHAIE